MVDFTWVDINSTGLRKAICMLAEKYHNGEELTNEKVGDVLHKTTQRSALKNAPIMLESIREMAKKYETSLNLFCTTASENGLGQLHYKYESELNCAKFGESGMFVGVSNSVPTVRDFESLKQCSPDEMVTILNLCDGQLYKKPEMA